jgi:hypothetical protein
LLYLDLILIKVEEFNGNATLKWNKFTKKQELVYEGAQGTPISYVYNDNGRLLQDTFLTRH